MQELQIDGSFGEGGGQILRSALGLSLVTGRPFRIDKIRAKRRKPGLMRQHLTAVQAAQEISGARVEGAELGSKELHFHPSELRPGTYRFAVGSAGSATLVFQTILPALLRMDATRVTFEGGTHNPWAPPYPFLEKSFLHVLRQMGVQISCTLEKHGFYPAGGGRFVVESKGRSTLQPLELETRPEIVSRRAIAKVAQLEVSIAKRELAVVRHKLGFASEECIPHVVKDSAGPGNILTLEFTDTNGMCSVFAGFGEIRRTAEQVASHAIRDARNWLSGDVPVCEHLADQLMIPFALAGEGSFTTLPLSRHATTNITIVRQFLDTQIEVLTQGRKSTVRFAS